MKRADASPPARRGPDDANSSNGSIRFGSILAKILDATPDLVGAATRDHRAVYMNRGGRRLLGVGEDEDVTGLDVLRFYPPEDARLIETVGFPTALATGSWSGDVVLLSGAEKRVPVHQIILSFESETGERLLTTFARDIGPRKESEVRLQESEERFRSTFEQAPLGIAQLAIDGRILWFNEKLCAILGMTRDDLARRTFLGLLHGDECAAAAGPELLLAGAVSSFETEGRMRRQDDTTVWTQLGLSLARDDRGKALYYVLVVADISDRHRASELERRVMKVLESMPDLVGTMTIGRVPLFLNPAGRKMIGIALDDENAPPDILAYHPEWARRLLLEEALPAVLAGHIWAGETAFLSKAGHEIPTRQVLFAHQGEELGDLLVTTIAHDISDLKRVQAEIQEARLKAEKANGEKSQILANMSHELRTPLTSVIGFSEMLVDGHYGEVNPRQRECLNNIVEAGHHLLDLINDVLDLAKVEAGRLTLSLEELDAGSLVADLVATVRVLAARKGLQVEIAVAEDVPKIVADPRRVKQIVLNLLSNAMKFTPAGGRIAVTVRLDGQKGVWIEVKDSGVGVDPEDQASLFEPFRQLDASNHRSQQGTGLGLALTRRLVEVHGGRVWLESLGAGQGTTFHVTLPAGGPPDLPVVGA